jgi:hypothetical protein
MPDVKCQEHDANGLLALDQHQDAIILVERINGPVVASIEEDSR